jgi:hypothetical protein
MVSTGTMASGSRTVGRDDGVRVARVGGLRRDLWALGVVAMGLVSGALVLRSAEPPEPPMAPRASAPASGITPPDPTRTDAGPAPTLPSRMPTTRAGKLRALRALGIRHSRGPDGKKQLDAAPVIEALNAAGVHEGIAVFPPPGTDPPKSGVIVPDGWVLPEGYVRHYQSTDDGKALPPILMFHPDYEFTDEQGNPVAVPPDRVVPPELAPPGFPVKMLEVPARAAR